MLHLWQSKNIGYEFHSCQKFWSHLAAALLSLCRGHWDLCFSPGEIKKRYNRWCELRDIYIMSLCEVKCCALLISAAWFHPEQSQCNVQHFLQPSWPRSAFPWKLHGQNQWVKHIIQFSVCRICLKRLGLCENSITILYLFGLLVKLLLHILYIIIHIMMYDTNMFF